jgi:outer membrane protein OmpA-like peptidoglycan-associated protein
MFRNSASARNRLAIVGILAVGLLGSYGCATQTWVIESIREMDKELVTRFERNEAAFAAEKVRVDGQLNEIRGIGVDARNRADAAQASANAAQTSANAAQAKANAADGRVTQALANRLNRTQVQQLEVTFETGKADVSASDRAALQGLLKVIADNPTYTVDVIGYTDSVGKADENVNLSWRREEAVRRFLAERGVPLNRFYFIGVGEEGSGDDVKDAAKRAKNRHVSVTIFKPVE